MVAELPDAVTGYGPQASPEDADVIAALFDEREEGQPAVLFTDLRPPG